MYERGLIVCFPLKNFPYHDIIATENFFSATRDSQINRMETHKFLHSKSSTQGIISFGERKKGEAKIKKVKHLKLSV
jgi:hypothetical protein